MPYYTQMHPYELVFIVRAPACCPTCDSAYSTICARNHPTLTASAGPAYKLKLSWSLDAPLMQGQVYNVYSVFVARRRRRGRGARGGGATGIARPLARARRRGARRRPPAAARAGVPRSAQNVRPDGHRRLLRKESYARDRAPLDSLQVRACAIANTCICSAGYPRTAAECTHVETDYLRTV